MAAPHMPVPVEARTATVYSGMATSSPGEAWKPIRLRSMSQRPLWLRSLAAPLLDSPVLPPPPPRVQARSFVVHPLVEFSGGGLCMAMAMANNRAALRLELVAGSRAAAVNLRF